jgi:hypothetical protein
MNACLLELAKTVQLNEPHNEKLRWAFALACANSIRHLVGHPEALAALDTLQRYVDGHISEQQRIAAAEVAAQIAQHHHGSTSIDGTAHAFVSATYAVANAIAGKAIETADYAAYTSVYNYGAYALNDPSSFEEVHRWQVNKLRELAAATT